jgi:hypothetical protein
MSDDTLRAHGMTLAISDQDLRHMEDLIEAARYRTMDENAGFYRLRNSPHACNKMYAVEHDAEVFEISYRQWLVTPRSFQCMDYFIRHFPNQQTRNGDFFFCGRNEIDRISNISFNYRKIYRRNGGTT